MRDERAPVECSCKVGRVVRDSLTPEINEALERRWLGDGEAEKSVRELAEWFNEAVLEARLDRAGVDTLRGEVSTLYSHLSGDESTGMETQATRQLQRRGLDVDDVTDDFVSHQTMYRHLRNCLDLEKDTSLSAGERLARDRERVVGFKNRMELIAEDALERLQSSGTIEGGSFDVLVNVRVTCSECGLHCDFGELLEREGCECP